MSTRVDPSGRRWVRAEVETPGSIEEVWQAISTENGLASWFTRADFELGEDGQPERLICHFGPDISSAATVTEWDPPRGFAVTSDEFIEGGPPVATDWRIEKSAGELCTLSVEHSLFVDTVAYDSHIEATKEGWSAFFRILQVYMTNYRGQPCALLEVMGAASEQSQAWDNLCVELGISVTEPGVRCAAPTGGPNFAGVVDTVPDDTEIILHIDKPTTGVAHLFLWPVGGQVLVPVRLYLYGENAAEVVSREERQWRSWMEDRFPFPQG